MKHKVSCHYGAIGIELQADRPRHEQIISACQCSFCRKHNARAFSDPRSSVTLTASEPEQLQRYSFGLNTAEQIVCRPSPLTVQVRERVKSSCGLACNGDWQEATEMVEGMLAEPQWLRGNQPRCADEP